MFSGPRVFGATTECHQEIWGQFKAVETSRAWHYPFLSCSEGRTIRRQMEPDNSRSYRTRPPHRDRQTSLRLYSSLLSCRCQALFRVAAGSNSTVQLITSHFSWQTIWVLCDLALLPLRRIMACALILAPQGSEIPRGDWYTGHLNRDKRSALKGGGSPHASRGTTH